MYFSLLPTGSSDSISDIAYSQQVECSSFRELKHEKEDALYERLFL